MTDVQAHLFHANGGTFHTYQGKAFFAASVNANQKGVQIYIEAVKPTAPPNGGIGVVYNDADRQASRTYDVTSTPPVAQVLSGSILTCERGFSGIHNQPPNGHVRFKVTYADGTSIFSGWYTPTIIP